MQRPQPLVLQAAKLQGHLLRAAYAPPLANAVPVVLEPTECMPVTRVKRVPKRHVLEVLLHAVEVRQRELPRAQFV